MRSTIFSLITIVVLFLLAAFGLQDEPDYRPKELKKSLKKFGNTLEENPAEVIIPDSVREAGTFQGRYFRLDDTAARVAYLYVGRVKSCRSGGCASGEPSLGSQPASEYFDYFVLFDRHCRVLEVQVYNYAATYGHQITMRQWLRQFVGYNGSEVLIPGKNIDAISGATISVNAIVYDITRTQYVLQRVLAPAV